MRPVKLLIIEPNQLFREGLRHLLGGPSYTVTGAVSTAANALDEADAQLPDLVMVGPGTATQTDAEIAWIRKRCPEPHRIRFVLLVDATDVDWPGCVAASGIDAVLFHNISSDVLRRSLDLVMLGQQFFPAAPASSLPIFQATLIPFPRHGGIRPPLVEPSHQREVVLSEREGQILRCLINGASNKEIAREVKISEATVKAHVKGLLRKVRATNRTQAAIWALNNNFRVSEALGQVTTLPPNEAAEQRASVRQHSRMAARPQS